MPVFIDPYELKIDSISSPSTGSAEIVSASYPTDLNPKSPFGELLVSEVRPGEYIELFNTTRPRSAAMISSYGAPNLRVDDSSPFLVIDLDRQDR